MFKKLFKSTAKHVLSEIERDICDKTKEVLSNTKNDVESVTTIEIDLINSEGIVDDLLEVYVSNKELNKLKERNESTIKCEIDKSTDNNKELRTPIEFIE